MPSATLLQSERVVPTVKQTPLGIALLDFSKLMDFSKLLDLPKQADSARHAPMPAPREVWQQRTSPMSCYLAALLSTFKKTDSERRGCQGAPLPWQRP